jgi:hypothetical protein
MLARQFRLIAITAGLIAYTGAAAAQMGDPFDAASLENAIKGMRVYKARMSEIVSMRVQYLNIQNRRSEAQTKGEREIEAYQKSQSAHRECVREKLDKLKNDPARMQKMQEKIMGLASNPAAMQKYAEASQAASAAAMKGDTAAMTKASAELFKVLGMDPKADTVAATTACGAAPKRPASVTEIEQLEKQADSLTIRLRRAETAADGDAARAAGVAPSRFAEMRERLATYVSRPTMFKAPESDLLAARKAEIVSLTKEQ